MGIIKKKRITIIFGTRPEAIKFALLIKTLKKYDFIETRVLLTGQHREMVELINKYFGIVVDKDLKLMTRNQTLNDLTQNILNGVREDIKKNTQDLVQASMKLGEAIYKSQQSGKPGDAPKDAKEEGKKDENVVDADFEEVKDENKEKSA